MKNSVFLYGSIPNNKYKSITFYYENNTLILKILIKIINILCFFHENNFSLNGNFNADNFFFDNVNFIIFYYCTILTTFVFKVLNKLNFYPGIIYTNEKENLSKDINSFGLLLRNILKKASHRKLNIAVLNTEKDLTKIQ